MVLAGLSARGTTKVSGLKHLDRGYDNIESKLRKVGARFIEWKADAFPPEFIDPSWERAGIGRRTRLKIERLRACGFKSHRSHCSDEHLQPLSAHTRAWKGLLGLRHDRASSP